ncbi:MAG TPA: amidohydrolase family protein [Micromonosporaceae bacterium]
MGRTILRGTFMLDCTGAEPRDDAVSIAVEGDRIAEISSSTSTGAPDQVLDLGGLTLLPGLLDLHSHLGVISWQPHEGYSGAMIAALMFDNARRCLASGHTTVRETGGADHGLVSVIERGLVEGPRVYPSGRSICQTSGHGDMRPLWWEHHCNVGYPGLAQLSTVADGVDEVRKAARENFRAGATQLKACMSGGILSHYDKLTDTQLSFEELAVMVEEAAARGTYVTGHAVNSAAIELGLRAGLRCFEHAFFLSRETADHIVAADASVVFTLGVLDRLARNGAEWGISADRIAKIAEVRRASLSSLEIARDAGVRIGCGTDLIGPEQSGRGGEIGLRADILGARKAIESATRVNAEIMGLGADLGTLEAGKLADVIAVRGNPVEDPWILQDADNVVFVMKAGVVYKNTLTGD